VQVLEFVHGLELHYVEAIGKHTIWLALEQVLRLVCGDVGNCGEHIGAMRRRALNTVSMVNPAFSCFVVDVKVLEIVIEIDRAGAKVSPEKRCVRGEDGRHINLTLAAERDCETGLPLVKVGDNGGLRLPGYILPEKMR
jgi:hypothetical protein